MPVSIAGAFFYEPDVASLTPAPYFPITDLNGLPINGAFVYTYVAGTNTPAPTYTDVTGLVANPNPVVANAYGHVKIWLPDSGAFKFIITDPNNVVLDTIDNITSPALSSAAVTALNSLKGAMFFFAGSEATALLGAAIIAGATKAARAPGTGLFTLAVQQIVNFQATMWAEAGGTATVAIYATSAPDNPIANSTITSTDADGAIAQNGAPITLPAGTYQIKGHSGSAVKQAWAVGYRITPT